MLQNAYLLAKIGADTAENEQNFAENLPKTDNYHTGLYPMQQLASHAEVERDQLHGLLVGAAAAPLPAPRGLRRRPCAP